MVGNIYSKIEDKKNIRSRGTSNSSNLNRYSKEQKEKTKRLLGIKMKNQKWEEKREEEKIKHQKKKQQQE
jgi:hypothetical protein